MKQVYDFFWIGLGREISIVLVLFFYCFSLNKDLGYIWVVKSSVNNSALPIFAQLKKWACLTFSTIYLASRRKNNFSLDTFSNKTAIRDSFKWAHEETNQRIGSCKNIFIMHFKESSKNTYLESSIIKQFLYVPVKTGWWNCFQAF